MFRPAADWLSTTSVSVALQNHSWMVATSQSIHILGICMVFTSACMINSRILGFGATGRTVSQLTNTLVPWMWRALTVLVATGFIQILAEPVRQFVTPAFWAKMLMIVIVVIMTALYARSVRRGAASWDQAGSRHAGAKLFAVSSTLLWFAIIFCGRFIGYTWTFYT
jgi:hypothetical protein